MTTGGVGFGNVSVEAIQFPGQKDAQPRLVGFALEPSSPNDSMTELTRRGITVGERRPLIAAGNGPAVRLVSATENTIQTLVIRVASLDRATNCLRDKQLLRADPEGRPTIDLSNVGDLDVRLVDK